MSLRADVFRQRAEHLLRLGRCEKNEERQRICCTLADSYEALARNEEWLEGEFPPSSNALSRSAADPARRKKGTQDAVSAAMP